MTKTPPTFQVTLDDGTVHTLEILHGDQLRAELEAPKNGIPLAFEQAPVHHTTLWVWAACVRTGITDLGFQAFMPTIRLVSRGTAPVDAPVDPTPPVPGIEGP